MKTNNVETIEDLSRIRHKLLEVDTSQKYFFVNEHFKSDPVAKQAAEDVANEMNMKLVWTTNFPS